MMVDEVALALKLVEIPPMTLGGEQALREESTKRLGHFERLL